MENIHSNTLQIDNIILSKGGNELARTYLHKYVEKIQMHFKLISKIEERKK